MNQRNELTKLFKSSMSVYLEQRQKSAGKNSSMSSVQNIENHIPRYLNQLLSFDYSNYIVKGSCGVGRWSEIPWVTIMNPQVTSSVSSGFYLTYLISSDMKNVYLTFMFAVTDNKELDQLIPRAKKSLKEEVRFNSKINFGEMENLGSTKRAKDYMKASVAYIQYTIDELPQDDLIWLNDLKDMLKLYERYINSNNRENPEYSNGEVGSENIEAENLIAHIYEYISTLGFFYNKNELINFYLSLKAKPFVIISGISGTGKTKIVQLFAEAIGATEENGQFKLIPVRPDWSDSSELLGYTDIKGDFIKGPLTEMVEHAHEYPELPHFVLLDEMNLARVEYYFSDVLSVMESRKRVDGELTSSTLITVNGEPLTLPGNLYIVGTVNMDETTHPFSKKVLDRANTIEFNEIDLLNFDSMINSESIEPIHVSNDALESSFIHLIDAFSTHEQLIREVSEKLEAINKHLEPIHAQVGYRVRDEISFYMAHNAEAEHLLSPNDAMDFCIIQKILPRVGGMEAVVRPVLENLETELSSYPRSKKKINEMLGRLDDDGFTSFWIS